MNATVPAELSNLPTANDPRILKFTRDAEGALAVANEFVIDSPEMYTLAGGELQQIKSRAKTLDEQRKLLTQPLDKLKKDIMALFEGPLNVLLKAESVLKRSMLTYQQAEEAKRIAAQRKAEEEARKEQERLRAQAEKKAAKAAEKGDTEKAETILASVPAIVAPVVTTLIPKVAGISTRPVWKFEITDPNLIPREYLMPDEKKLAGIAKTMNNTLQIPGVRFYAENTIAAGAGR